MFALPATSAWTHRARTYASFVRFEHTLFSLPLILAGVFSAAGDAMPASRWALVALAAVGARTAAMALNRLVDRRLDALNPRTRSRELPSGAMAPREAWALLAVSIALYVTACAALGPWFLRMSPIPLVVFAGYPYLKRVTPLCHFGVGLALALAPLAGYAAAHPDLKAPGTAMKIAAFAFAWVSGFDIIYATLDEEFDRAHGVKSMVVSLGRKRALWLAALLHLVAFWLLAVAAVDLWRGLPWFPVWAPWALPVLVALVASAGVLLFLEQRWAEDVNLAFFKVNVWVGFVVLAVVAVARYASHTPDGPPLS
jgi:4-hydroxybenzoate polyprenyltransferase